MNADLYLAFTDSDDEGDREEPVASVDDAHRIARPKFSAPVAPTGGSHCIHPPPSVPVSGDSRPLATAGVLPATAIDDQADKDEEDDLLAGLNDPF